MKPKLRILLLIGFLLLVSNFAGGISFQETNSSKDYLGSVQQNLTYFAQVYKQVSQRYVDVVDPEKFLRVGIDAMLEAVDDYTVLIEDEENAQLQIMTTGRYGGLGMVIAVRDGWPTLMEPPYDSTPAQKAGCREGDRIVEIDGVSTKEKTVSEVAQQMRGEIGTSVAIKIEREGKEDLLEFRLVRAEIIVNDVVFSGIVQDNIGYVKLARFSKNSPREMINSVRELREAGMQSLILDLRNNPGGLLDAAVGVADIFLPKGKLIVSTRGRDSESQQKYYSESDPILPSQPLVVLVNEFSASASEIVAGAIQDLDRGIIIGQPTFGKGLVQSVISLNRDSRLKLTTAKYYLPSGRLIQKERNSEIHNDILLDPPQTTAHDSAIAFETFSGRKVKGNGGISPDIKIQNDTLTTYQEALVRQSMIFNYAVYYANTHDKQGVPEKITNAMALEFQEFLIEKEFDYKTPSHKELIALENAMKKDGILKKGSKELQRLAKILREHESQNFDDNLAFIRQQLLLEIAAKIGGTEAKTRLSFEWDNELREGLKVLKDKPTFYSYLKPRNEI